MPKRDHGGKHLTPNEVRAILKPPVGPRPPHCVHCKHFMGGGDDWNSLECPTPLGQCRRYPPSVGPVKVTKAGPLMEFPVVKADSWCGEWAAQVG